MRWLIGILAVCAIGLAALALTIDSDNQTEEGPEEELHQLFDEAWAFRMQEDPLFATSVGEHQHNDRLPEVTLEAYERRLNREREFLERLHAIDRSALDRDDQINYDIFEHIREDRIAELEFRDYLIPITNRSGFHISFPELDDDMPLNTADDYEDYIARLNAFEQYAQDHIEIMRYGQENGYSLPAVVLDGIENTIEPNIVGDPTRSELYDPLEEMPDAIPENVANDLQRDARRAIMDSVVPGYRAFLEFMRDEYVPNAREDIAASNLPDGDAYYEHLVRSFTTLDQTPEEVHETGLEEVERIREEMMEIVAERGWGDDFDGFVEHLRTDDQFYADSEEELLQEVARVLKRMDGKLPELFETLPRMPYGIREVPEHIAPYTTTAYYSRPAGDGTRAGFYYVNTYDLSSRPLYEVEALSLHEAVPGHHLQIALQQELEDLPPFRRFSSFTAFVEGWALYAERLGLEVDHIYEDPYSDFGRLSYEMWRALRLVVDTGMHYLDWSRADAIEFMAENSALSMHNIESEVDRYIAWPGQALAYKTGELKIRDLRARAEEELGGDFDLRAFHDVVLENGSVPLPVLEEVVERHIRNVE